MSRGDESLESMLDSLSPLQLPSTSTEPPLANEALRAQVVREQDKRKLYRAARMRYLQGTRNPTCFKIPEQQGKDLFKLWAESGEDWGKVAVSCKHLSSSREKVWQNKDMKTRGQLLAFYNDDSDVVDAIIKEKTEKKQYMDNPDCPGNLNARLYKVWSGTGSSHKDARQQDREMQLTGSMGHEGGQRVAAVAVAPLRASAQGADLALLAGGKDQVPKPKKVPKPKSEAQLAEKDRKDLVRKLASLRDSMEKHAVQLEGMGTQDVLAAKCWRHKAMIAGFLSQLEGLPIKGSFTQADVKELAEQASSAWGDSTVQQDASLAQRLVKPAPKPKAKKQVAPAEGAEDA